MVFIDIGLAGVAASVAVDTVRHGAWCMSEV